MLLHWSRRYVNRRIAIGLSCRHYGYVHVPKKTPPHLLGPGGIWRKCFVVHPHTQTLDPLTKYQWLTKTSVVQGLPEDITSIKLPGEALLTEFEVRARETLVCQISRDRSRPSRSKVGNGLLQGVLASLWTLGQHHLAHSSLTFDPKVECYWRKDGVNFLCISNPLFLFHTASPLELFCDPEFNGGKGIPPVEYKPFHLGLFEHSFDQIQPFGGCKRYSPYSFPHTVISFDNKSRTRDQFLAHGLMQLFSVTAARTVQNGYPLEKDLHYPLAAQGVLTDGRQFTFMSYQLNTLNLNQVAEEEARQNVLWAGPTLELYQDIELGEGFKGFNVECCRLLLQCMLHIPQRKAPSVSGFTLAEMEKKARVERREERKRLAQEAKKQGSPRTH